MRNEIRHRRLYAFYHCKVLNVLEMLIVASLSSMGLIVSNLIPLTCAGIAFILFLCYSCWLWFRKPDRVVINKYVADITSITALYVLSILTLRPGSKWWYAAPLLCALWALAMLVIKPKSDEIFEIKSAD